MSEYIVQVRKVGADGELRGSALTYRYGSPLEPGDRVVCPATPYSDAFIAEVTELGSGFTGYVKWLLCRVAPDRGEPFAHVRPLLAADRDEP